MGKNYVESSLKRFLKRKVKITMGFVIAFMISGNFVFAEDVIISYKDKLRAFITLQHQKEKIMYQNL